MKKDNVLFDFTDFEITKRELIASVSILALLLVIGILISEKITQYQTDQKQIYNKAVKISDKEMFHYGMETNVGNAFVYGDLTAVDTVTYPEIGGEYMTVTKVKEEYTRHTRTVDDYDKDGNKIGSHEEVYYSWDRVGSEKKQCRKVTFLDIEFDYGNIYKPSEGYIDTIKDSLLSETRYVYYGSPTKYTGTIFTNLNNNTINDTKFYNEMNIQETVDFLETSFGTLAFWIVWSIFIAICLFGFFYLENEWLE